MWCGADDQPTTQIVVAVGGVSDALAHSRPPGTTFHTRFGKPALSISSMINSAVSGTFSLGLRTNVFPQASASGNIHIGTIAGKLNGVMPTQTPSGCNIVSQSTPRARFSSVSPINNVGTLQAYSMFSIPR